MLATHLCLCLLAFIAIAHLLAGRIPNWLFVFLPSVFFVPSIKPMEIDWDKVPDWISAIFTALGVVFAVVAYVGWRKQLRETKLFDMAFDFSRLLYSVLHSFLNISVTHDAESIKDETQRFRALVRQLKTELEVYSPILGETSTAKLSQVITNVPALVDAVVHNENRDKEIENFSRSIAEAHLSLRKFMTNDEFAKRIK